MPASYAKRFEETDAQALGAIIRAHPLATIVAAGPEGLQAHHIPLVLRGGALVGHMSRADTLQRCDGAEALAIFRAADGYVSPSWYPSKAEHGRVVPTWNYVVAHVHGRLRVIDDRAWIRAQVEELTNQQEAALAHPWKVSDAPGEFVEKMLGGIIGFEIPIARLEGVRKASQNRDERDREGVRAGFEAQRGPEAALLLTGG
jgi:transcriptional regulator